MNEAININYIKNAACRFLLKENITRLPVNSAKILIRRKYYLRPYTDVHDWINCTPSKLVDVFGNAFVSPIDSPIQYNVAINMNCRVMERNWSIMHALACIELGNVTYAPMGDFAWDPSYITETQEADLFSLYALCPDIILNELKLETTKELQMTCCVPYIVAETKKKYFNGYDFKANPLPDLLEQKIKYNFREFLTEHNRRNNLNWEFACEF